MISAPEVREGFEEFLQHDLEKELLRFTTAGSVDDGKSTLIGRLLHDAKGVYEDQLASVKKSRVNRSTGPIDFSLLTDGLRAEREQGITIDVAYRYFQTPKRKFIIADTPGHEQYTRNMATGASTANLAVILVDGTKGLLPQTRRHSYIAALLGIPNVLVAINKMDLIGYQEEVFLRLQDDFLALAERLKILAVQCVPVSAPCNDVVFRPHLAGASRGRTDRASFRNKGGAVPCSVRHPSRRELSRLCRPSRRRNSPARRLCIGAAVGADYPHTVHRHVRRRAQCGFSFAVRHSDTRR